MYLGSGALTYLIEFGTYDFASTVSSPNTFPVAAAGFSIVNLVSLNLFTATLRASLGNVLSTQTVNDGLVSGGSESTGNGFDFNFGYDTGLPAAAGNISSITLNTMSLNATGFDDFAFTMAPEPASAGLFSVAGLTLLARRRRRVAPTT